MAAACAPTSDAGPPKRASAQSADAAASSPPASPVTTKRAATTGRDQTQEPSTATLPVPRVAVAAYGLEDKVRRHES